MRKSGKNVSLRKAVSLKAKAKIAKRRAKRNQQ